MYRAKYRDTNFGKPLSQKGNPGVNSGVLLLHFERLRKSLLYNKLLLPEQVKRFVTYYYYYYHYNRNFYHLIIIIIFL